MINIILRHIGFVFLFAILHAQAESVSAKQAIETYTPTVVRVINHDQNAYTQGLYYDGEVRFESSGGYGKSFIRRFDQRGQQTKALPEQYFAEGLTVIDDTLYLLTWKAETLLLYDKTTLTPKGSIRFEGQGWGLTHNDEYFIMSNGSDRLFFRNLSTFAIEKTLVVEGVDKLNELEYIDGIIWANRWYDDKLYAISAQTACVLATLDASDLRQQSINLKGDNVTNGIAYNAQENVLLVTGKRWSRQFFLSLPPVTDDNKPCR